MNSHPHASAKVSRWVIGTGIILFAILAFTKYQNSRPTPGLLPTATRQMTTVAVIKSPSLQPTVKPRTLYVSVGNANVLTTIIEVYLDRSGGWDLSLLNQFAGHLQGTSNIGQKGNAVLTGHVELKDGTPGPFAYLNALKAGDSITILSDDPKTPMLARYTITTVKTSDPSAIDEIRDHGYEELTLVTCQDWSSQSRTYQKRLIVHARPVQRRG